MNRRSFLSLSGATLAAAALPRGGECLFGQAQSAGADPVVEISSGRIRGTIDTGVRVFKGVAYGASTAGANRFMPPVKPQPWTGVRDASVVRPARAAAISPDDSRDRRCAHRQRPDGRGLPAAECLDAGATGNGRRPVMVWFHGGGQRTGSGNSIFYDGAALARKHDVVVVTVTHRLNAFAHL